jgi:hypothetical protein
MFPNEELEAHLVVTYVSDWPVPLIVPWEKKTTMNSGRRNANLGQETIESLNGDVRKNGSWLFS